MADFTDMVTTEPRGDVRSTKIQKGLAKALSAGSPEAAEKALTKIEHEVEVLKKRARTKQQKDLLDQYYETVAVQKALGEAKLIQLLGAEDEEIQLRAAKELRGGGRGQIKVDKGMFVTTREDPEITQLKEIE